MDGHRASFLSDCMLLTFPSRRGRNSVGALPPSLSSHWGKGSLPIQLPLQTPSCPLSWGSGSTFRGEKPCGAVLKMWREIALLRELLTFSWFYRWGYWGLEGGGLGLRHLSLSWAPWGCVCEAVLPENHCPNPTVSFFFHLIFLIEW